MGKSEIKPKQKITHLGFEINSTDLTISLTNNKKESICNKINILKTKQICSIREVSRLIGSLVAANPTVNYG